MKRSKICVLVAASLAATPLMLAVPAYAVNDEYLKMLSNYRFNITPTTPR